MGNASPINQVQLWRSEQLFNIDFASYSLSHYSFSKHFHGYYVIELVVKGTDTFYCAGKTYTATNNQLVFINPGEVHTGSTMEDNLLQYFSLYPDKKTIQAVAEALEISIPGDINFQYPVMDQPIIAEKFIKLFRSFQLSANILLQEELFFDYMNELLRQINQTDHTKSFTAEKDKRVQLLIDYIKAHFKEEISLQQLASFVSLNPFHLVRLFKKKTGVSPYDYLLITRTEYARQLLRSGYQVQDAAIEAGFYDSSHFNRLFRKIAGTSPKSFRLSKSQYHTIFSH